MVKRTTLFLKKNHFVLQFDFFFASDHGSNVKFKTSINRIIPRKRKTFLFPLCSLRSRCLLFFLKFSLWSALLFHLFFSIVQFPLCSFTKPNQTTNQTMLGGTVRTRARAMSITSLIATPTSSSSPSSSTSTSLPLPPPTSLRPRPPSFSPPSPSPPPPPPPTSFSFTSDPHGADPAPQDFR